MIIDVDMGNTRIKWRTSTYPERVYAHESELEACSQWEALEAAVRVRIASVVDSSRVDQLVAQIKRRMNVTAEVALVQDGLGGVRVGYGDAAALGVDRWLALLAARDQAPHHDVIVVSAGTAVTIDYLAASGQHLGGYILPGWQLSTKALLGETARVRCATPKPTTTWRPGNSTLHCVEGGLALMYRGVMQSFNQLELPGFSPAKILLTGGDGLLLGQFVGAEFSWVYEPSLVLQGLGIALP